MDDKNTGEYPITLHSLLMPWEYPWMVLPSQEDIDEGYYHMPPIEVAILGGMLMISVYIFLPILLLLLSIIAVGALSR